MTARRTKTAVPYSADQMFDLVAEVRRYPEFVPHCRAIRIVRSDVDENGEGELVSDMVVAYKAFRETFRTHVTLDRRAHRIETRYLAGPFRHLYNLWAFRDLPDGGSEVDFTIDFEFRNFLLQAAASAVFERAFAKMSEAFVERARAVYPAPA